MGQITGFLVLFLVWKYATNFPISIDNTSDLDKPVSTATQTALNNKVDKVAGKGLSTNDFTDADKQKLDNIEPIIVDQHYD